MQQILDREEAGVLEIGGTTRPDALQELQGRGEHIVCHGSRRPSRCQGGLLNDDGLTPLDENLANARGQFERIIETDAGRLLRRA